MSLFVRISTEALTDAKLLAAGSDAFTLWVRGLLYSKVHLTDGFVPAIALPVISIGIRNPRAAAQRLVSLDLWQRLEDGFTVGLERWSHWQTTSDEVEKTRAGWRDRQRKSRGKRTAVTRDSRDQSTEYRVQSTEPEAPLPPVPVTQAALPPSTGANGELMAVTWLCEELGVVLAPAQRPMAAQHIAFSGRELGAEGPPLLGLIRDLAIEARNRGEPVDAWYLADGRWRRPPGEKPMSARERKRAEFMAATERDYGETAKA